MNTRIQAKTIEMGQQHVLRLLIRYSIPAAIGNAAFTIYNMVDRIFIGRSGGTEAIAGISITFPAFMICIAIGMMIGMGGGARASLHLGEGRHADAELILGNVVALFLLAGLSLTLLGQLFLAPLMQLMGASAATLPYAMTYMRILLFFTVFDFLAMGMNGMLRAEGNSRISMFTLVSGSLLNILLDYLFIVVFGWGIAGAAWATGISKAFSSTWILLHFTRSKHRALTLRLSTLKLRLHIVLSILHIGISPFLMQFVSSAVIIILNRALFFYGGDTAVGAMGAVFSLMMLMMMPSMGVAQGAQPIIGFNYGAKRYDRVRAVIMAMFSISFIATILATVLIESWPHVFIGWFSKQNTAMISTGSTGARIMLCCFPLAGIQMLIIQYFQATGRPLISILLNIFRQIICFLTLLLILPRFFGLLGVWAIFPTGDVLAFTVSSFFMLRELKQLHAANRSAPYV